MTKSVYPEGVWQNRMREARGRRAVSLRSARGSLINPRSLIAFRARAAPLPPSRFNIHSASRLSVLLRASDAWFSLFVLETTPREIYLGNILPFVLTIWSHCSRRGHRADTLSDGRAAPAIQCATNNVTFMNIDDWFVTITFLITWLL